MKENVSNWPKRFEISAHTEPLLNNSKLLDIIRPYRVYRATTGGQTTYQVRCNTCGAICQNTWTIIDKRPGYILACPKHIKKDKDFQKFIDNYKNLLAFMETYRII